MVVPSLPSLGWITYDSWFNVTVVANNDKHKFQKLESARGWQISAILSWMTIVGLKSLRRLNLLVFFYYKVILSFKFLVKIPFIAGPHILPIWNVLLLLSTDWLSLFLDRSLNFYQQIITIHDLHHKIPGFKGITMSWQCRNNNIDLTAKWIP